MKKISLKNLNLKEVEQLSREQLKNVLGGFTGGTGTDDGETTAEDDEDAKCGKECTKHSQCPSNCPSCNSYTTSGGLCGQ